VNVTWVTPLKREAAGGFVGEPPHGHHPTVLWSRNMQRTGVDLLHT
jgi:hypothetical protein